MAAYTGAVRVRIVHTMMLFMLVAHAVVMLVDGTLLVRMYLWAAAPEHCALVARVVEAVMEFCNCMLDEES